jgi:hypothetical protein
MSYKAGFEFTGQSELSFNAHVFATEAEATIAGNELMSRWMLPIGFQVIEVDREPTAIIKDGRSIGIYKTN